MSRPSDIPEALIMPLFEQWKSGKNYNECAIWLFNNHNIRTQAQTISRRLKYLKDAELQAKRDAVRERAAEQSLDYIKIIDHDIMALNRITNKLLATETPEDAILAKQLVETKLKLIDKQMNLTGMDKEEKDELNHDVIVDTLLDKLPKNN